MVDTEVADKTVFTSIPIKASNLFCHLIQHPIILGLTSMDEQSISVFIIIEMLIGFFVCIRDQIVFTLRGNDTVSEEATV